MNIQLLEPSSSKRNREEEVPEVQKKSKKVPPLPSDILDEIFSFAHFNTYGQLSLVCKEWHQVIKQTPLFSLYDFLFYPTDYLYTSRHLEFDKYRKVDKEIKYLIEIYKSKNGINSFTPPLELFLELITKGSARSDDNLLKKTILQFFSYAPIDISFWMEKLDKIDSKIRPESITKKFKELHQKMSYLQSFNIFDPSIENVEEFSNFLDQHVYNWKTPYYHLTLTTVLENHFSILKNAYENSTEKTQRALFHLLLRLSSSNKHHISYCRNILSSSDDKEALLLALKNPDIFDSKRFFTHIKGWSNDYDIALASVQKDGLKLEKFPKFADCEEIVLAAVKKNGNALQYASSDLKNNERIVARAFSNNHYSLKMASLNIRKKYVEHSSNLRYALGHNQEENCEIVRHAIKKCRSTLYFIDEEIIASLLKTDGMLLEFCCDEIKEKLYLIRQAISQNPQSIQFIKKREIIKKLLETNGMLFNFLPEELKDDLEIAEIAIKRTEPSVEYSSNRLAKTLSGKKF